MVLSITHTSYSSSINVWCYLKKKNGQSGEMGTIHSTKNSVVLPKMLCLHFSFHYTIFRVPSEFQTSYHNHGCATLVKRKKANIFRTMEQVEPSLNMLCLLLWSLLLKNKTRYQVKSEWQSAVTLQLSIY